MQKIIIGLIKIYRKYISPLKRTKCPYYPSCSEYGLEAVRKHGALKGCLLAFWRILRCNPFSKGGYDPVPEPIHIRRKRSARNIVDSEFHTDL